MPKVKAKYETVFIVDVTIGEEKTTEIVDKFKTLISENSEVIKIDEWGKRRLAYPIDDMPEGHYVLIQFECTPDFPAELDRVYNITEGLMRSMTLVMEE